MSVFITYILREVYLNDDGDISVNNVREFNSVKDAESFKLICAELKPDGKFIIEEEVEYD